MGRPGTRRRRTLSTNQKIAIAVGVTAAVVLIGSSVLAKPKPKFDFSTRNLEALNAVVDAMIADPNLQVGPLNTFADRLAYFGFQEQEQKMRARAKRASQTVDKTVPFHGF